VRGERDPHASLELFEPGSHGIEFRVLCVQQVFADESQLDMLRCAPPYPRGRLGVSRNMGMGKRSNRSPAEIEFHALRQIE
jgi:hypothetical protein